MPPRARLPSQFCLFLSPRGTMLAPGLEPEIWLLHQPRDCEVLGHPLCRVQPRLGHGGSTGGAPGCRMRLVGLGAEQLPLCAPQQLCARLHPRCVCFVLWFRLPLPCWEGCGGGAAEPWVGWGLSSPCPPPAGPCLGVLCSPRPVLCSLPVRPALLHPLPASPNPLAGRARRNPGRGFVAPMLHK